MTSPIKLHPHQQAAIESMIKSGLVQFADVPVGIGKAGHSVKTPADADPTEYAEALNRHGAEIEHIDEDGVITFADPKAVDPNADWLADYGNGRGLNTDDFSQRPTIDADKSAAWNRKAKTVKPGSFAARRMAAEE